MMIQQRSIHRMAGTVLAAGGLYLGVTGSLVQMIDIAALASNRPASDADMSAIREGIDGPGNFQVIAAPDYAAQPLPASFAYQQALVTTGRAVRAARPQALPSFVEFRIAAGRPVAQVKVGVDVLRFDASDGAALAYPPEPRRHGMRRSAHGTLKNWHRLFAFGDQILVLNALVGIGLLVMIVTGLAVYAKLHLARRLTGRSAPFWNSGGTLRSLHRGTSIVAAAFLLVVAVTGTWLSVDSFMLGMYRLAHGGMPPSRDVSSPLPWGALAPMLAKTLEGDRAAHGDRAIVAVRLRSFAGMPQGVIIGRDGDTDQFVYDAATGREVSQTEPGYPEVGFPFGWQLHETVKRIHRGDYFGLPGRVMDLLAGLALVFLSASGFVLYLDLWKRRRRAGRGALFWK